MGFRGNSKEKEKKNRKNDIKALLWDSQNSSTLILKIKIKLKDCHNRLLSSFGTAGPDCPPPAPHFWLYFWPSRQLLACRGWDAKGVLPNPLISRNHTEIKSWAVPPPPKRNNPKCSGEAPREEDLWDLERNAPVGQSSGSLLTDSRGQFLESSKVVPYRLASLQGDRGFVLS